MGLEILGITLFVLLIGASIALHEIGHLVPAKKFGVRVTDYMVGFGPTIWSKVKGETRYGPVSYTHLTLPTIYSV